MVAVIIAIFVAILWASDRFFPPKQKFARGSPEAAALAAIRDNPRLDKIFVRRHLPAPSRDDSYWESVSERDSMDASRSWYCPDDYIVTYDGPDANGESEDQEWVVNLRAHKVGHLVPIPGTQGGGIVGEGGRIPLCEDGKPPFQEPPSPDSDDSND